MTATECGRFVLTGAWNVASSSARYAGPKNDLAQFVYWFWPVKPGVMWFKNGVGRSIPVPATWARAAADDRQGAW